MLAALFVLGLLGYAVLYTGLAAFGSGESPGILESLTPSFSGASPTDWRALLPTRSSPKGTPKIPGVRGEGKLTPQLVALLGAVRTFVAARYPGAQLVVLSTYRPGAIVAGTTSVSEHAKANAADLRIMRRGVMDKRAMDGLYRFLLALPTCELCWDHKGGCTTSHTDHVHVAPSPCRAS